MGNRFIIVTYIIMIAVALVTVLCACTYKQPPTTEELWDAAMQDSVFADDDEVFELVCLTKDDEMAQWNDEGDKVLLVSWHDEPDACVDGESFGDGEIWATSLPEVVEWYGSNSDCRDWDLRFEQVLGLPESNGYTHFTMFWISPDNVIRPAYETDVTKQMHNDITKVEGEYYDWFNGNIMFSYFQSAYPWTRLGYTYDWGNPEVEYGLSEFLVRDPSTTTIECTLSTREFVRYLDVCLNTAP